MQALPLSPSEIREVKTLHLEICNNGKSMLQKAIRIGEILSSAKSKLKPGEWSDFFAASGTDMAGKTAYNYMRIFDNREHIQNCVDLSEAYLLLKNKTPENPESRNSLETKAGTGNSFRRPPSKSTTYENSDSQNGDSKPLIKQGFQQKPPPVYDDTDTWTAIPEDALPFWGRKQEIQDLLTDISQIKCTVEEAKNRNDPMFSKVSNAVIAELQKIYAHIMEAKPYAVCTTCMGRFTVQPKGCSFCGDKGLISKWQWETQSRKEVKEMRMKMAAKRATA